MEWDTTANSELHITMKYHDSTESPALALKVYPFADTDADGDKMAQLQGGESSKLLYGDAEQGGSVWSCGAALFDKVMGTKYLAYANDAGDEDELHQYHEIVFVVLESAVVVINAYSLDED